LFFSAISFAGYLARRAVGAHAAYPLAGLLGGIVSSTSVTLSFARASRHTQDARLALAFGVVAACTVLYLRVAVATAALRAELAVALWPYLTLPFLVGAAVLLLGARHLHQQREVVDAPRNPLQILEALQMAAVFQIVLVAIELVRRFGGDTGVIASGAVLGLTDLDALTLSMTRDAATAIPAAVAAQAIAIGLVSNTALKLGMAVVLGASGFRRVVGVSLAGMIMAILVGWLLT
jgi:uncharacterized membrane protein (DUF4010 family)